jgi:hypothetical protein
MVWEIYGSGAGVDIPVVPQLPETFITYMITLDHFSGTTSNITVIPNIDSVGPNLTLSL